MILRLFAITLALFWSTVALAQSGYQIRAGDRLAIEVLEDPALNRTLLVLPDGSVSFPLVGSIGAAGRSVDSFQSDLAQALSPNFARTPTVFVTVAALRPDQPPGFEDPADLISIYIVGELSNPGLLQVERGTTLLQALALTGGFTRFAATKRIQLRRHNPATGEVAAYTFNFKAIERGARITGRTVLSEGDVIIVPQRRLFE